MKTVYEALSHPVRRMILKLLREKTMSAGDIADHFDLSKSTLTGHFIVLKAADLVETERSGTTINYSLKLSVLESAIAALIDQFDINSLGGDK